jgi:NitT/TauT family transport system substrate-binding protein
LVDERDLWPDRLFPTALVVARGDFARERPAMMATLVDAVAGEVDRARQSPSETLGVVGGELARLLGKRLPTPLLEAASHFVDYTRDPMRAALDTIADDVFALGLAPRSSSRTLLG